MVTADARSPLRQALDAGTSEDDFLAAVRDLATLTGWHFYHTHDSRRSPVGFPDVVLCRPPRVIFCELKAERGKLTAPQMDWLASLDHCPAVEVFNWRPRHWAEIEQVLR